MSRWTTARHSRPSRTCTRWSTSSSTDRGAHRGARPGARRPRAGIAGHGGVHGRHFARHGAGDRGRATGGVRGSGRPASACRGPRARHPVRSGPDATAFVGIMGMTMSKILRRLAASSVRLLRVSLFAWAWTAAAAAPPAATPPSAAAPSAAAQPFDVVIVNGRIVDGTGSPWYSGDVGIRDGRIAAIGKFDRPRDAAHRRRGRCGRAGLHRHAGAIGTHHPGRPAPAVEDLPGHHH